MKRCPTCNQTFSDPNLTFCTADGTPLIKTEAPADDPEATIVSPSASHETSSGPPASQGQPPAPSDWKGPAYQPPGQLTRPPAEQKRKAWPWVIGIIALLLLALAGLGIAAAFLIPNMMRAAQNRNQNSSSVPANTRQNENSTPNSNSNPNSNSSGVNENSNQNENDDGNANANSDGNTPPPADQEQVLSDLKNIEDQWTVANLNADRKKLARILADDYVGTSVDGVIEGKADYLKNIKRDSSIKHWEFQNLKLALKGNRATLTGTVNLDSSEQDEALVLRFTDKFVWRDGRWQAVGSEVTPVK
jgi:hypothetical protein